MKIHSAPWLIAAVVLGFVILAFIHKLEVFGASCYYIGSFSLSTACIQPWLYYGAWLAAVVMAGIGLFGPISDTSSRQGPDKATLECQHEFEPQGPTTDRCWRCGITQDHGRPNIIGS